MYKQNKKRRENTNIVLRRGILFEAVDTISRRYNTTTVDKISNSRKADTSNDDN